MDYIFNYDAKANKFINIDKLAKQHKTALKRDGFAPIETPNDTQNIYKQIQEYKRTRSLKLAADIIENLNNYHVLDHDLFYHLTEDSAELQELKEKQRKSARRTNGNLTPEQLSDRNRKAAISRWNKVKNNNLIKDIK